MAFHWNRFLDLARSLQKNTDADNPDEAVLRTVLSRAYYGAFCHARNYARDYLGFTARNDPDDHGRLRAHLRGKRRKGDADRLDRLRQWRNESDYLDELGFDVAAAAVAALGEADRVFLSLAPPPPRSP